MRGALKIKEEFCGKTYVAKILPGQRFEVYFWGFAGYEALYTRKGKVLIFNDGKILYSFPNARNFKNWNYKKFISEKFPVINLGMGYSDIVILQDDWATERMENDEVWYYEIKN